MTTPGNDPFSGTTTRNLLQHVISPKIVSDGSTGYAVKADLINVDNIYIGGNVVGPNGVIGGGGFVPLATTYVAGGRTATNTLYRSTDGGTTWTPAPVDPFNGTYASKIAFNGSRWVAVGANSLSNVTTSIAYSDDGLNWTAATTNPFSGGPPGSFAVGGYSVRWNGSYWVACGTDGGNTVCLVYSYNGDVWYTSATNPFSGGFCSDVYWNGNLWVAVGKNSTSSVQVATSTNGVTWTASTGTPAPYSTGYYPTSISWNGNIWVIVGGDDTKSIYYSYDGNTWTAMSGTDPLNTPSWYRVKWNGSYFLAVGSQITARSFDGKTWVASPTPPFAGVANINDVTWNGTNWIACSDVSPSNFSQSTDGVTWTTITSSPLFSYVNGIENSTSFWKTTPTTNTSAILKLLSSSYFSTSNLI